MNEQLLQQILQSINDLNLTLLKIADNTKSTWDLNWNSISSIATGASAIGTVVLACLTWQMVKEMKETRQEESRPYVIAHLELKEKFIYFICKNIGKTCAYDVEVEFNKPIMVNGKNSLKSMLFSKNIPAMPPGYEIKTFINSGPEILNATEHEKDVDGRVIIEITIKYTSGKNVYRDQYTVDLSCFKNVLYASSNEYLMRRAIESIASDFSNISKQTLVDGDAIRFLMSQNKSND